jgi:EAL domain-containing protein (putative c-di-GMP-specific phosphodiesterase class I)
MYQAKKAGRNTVRLFDPKMQEVISARNSLEGDLRTALERGEFQLHYQIQVDATGRPIGAEALIRWMHPGRGLVYPAAFIPLAEESGLMPPIGRWVLETACGRLALWQREAATRDLILAVNVSPLHFHQADFAAQVGSLAQGHHIDPTRLRLEVTEGSLSKNVENAIAGMAALREIGVRIALDDFGSGYSSLHNLKRFPIDQLKIDPSFVRDLATDARDGAMVSAIVAMAGSLDLDLVAEGVETEDQHRILLDRGCAGFQGYLFGKPLPIGQFEAELRQR